MVWFRLAKSVNWEPFINSQMTPSLTHLFILGMFKWERTENHYCDIQKFYCEIDSPIRETFIGKHVGTMILTFLSHVCFWMNEWWMMHLYSALLCIVVQSCGGSLLNHHQCAASTWMMRRLPQDNSTSALTTHQLQVERRESHWANQVDGDY